MQDIDLTGVDPRRWPEIRRRIAAIRAYIALGRGDGAQRDAFAAELGLTPMTFLSLVKAWKEHGKASRLPGSGALDRGQPRPARSLPEATHAAIRASIAALGVDARHIDMVADVNERCDAVPTKRPSTGMVQRYVMQARRTAPPRAGVPEILVGVVVAKLPILLDGAAALPNLLLAVLSPEGTIAAHVLVDGEDAAAVGTLLQRLKGEVKPGATARPLIVPMAIMEAVTAAASIVALPGNIISGPTSTRLPILLGNAIGMMEIAHRRKPTTHAPRDGSPMNAPLSGAEAAAAIRHAVAAHNARRGGVSAFEIMHVRHAEPGSDRGREHDDHARP